MTAETRPKRTRKPKPAQTSSKVVNDADDDAEEVDATDSDALALTGEPTPAELEAVEPEVESAPRHRPGKALVPLREGRGRDLLQRYMDEAGRHPVLSREDERALALRYVETHDVDAARKLVLANLRLVVKIAFEYHRNAFALLDLVQEGNVGLLHAVEKFDPRRDVKLSTYAAWWIRAYILRFIMENWRMVKLGTTQAQRKLFFNLKKERDKLLAQGIEVGPKLLAEKLQVTEQEVVDMDRRLSQDELSLDAPMSDDSQESRHERIAGSGASAEDRLGDEELASEFKRHLAAFSATLTDEKERFILEKRLTAEEPLKLQEIGDRYGFTRERARQIEAKLMARLKVFLKERIKDFDWLATERED